MTWHTPTRVWAKLKPKARAMRTKPTAAESALWMRLRDRQLSGVRFRRQHALGQFVVDFYALTATLIVEVDGPIHKRQAAEDAVRDGELHQLGFRGLRVSNDDVLRRPDQAVERIRAALQIAGDRSV